MKDRFEKNTNGLGLKQTVETEIQYLGKNILVTRSQDRFKYLRERFTAKIGLV